MTSTILAEMNFPNLRIERSNTIVHQTTRGISAVNITAHCACKLKCNNGWMNVLETRLSAFIKPMILAGAETPLNVERQVLLAVWTIKTAMTHEFTDPQKNHYFTRAERKHVETWLQPPEDTWIWLGRSAIVSQVHTHPILLRIPESLSPAPSLFAFTLSVGQFLVQVLAYRHNEWQGRKGLLTHNVPFSNALIPLWPRRTADVVIWPPQKDITEDDLIHFHNRFFPITIQSDGSYLFG